MSIRLRPGMVVRIRCVVTAAVVRCVRWCITFLTARHVTGTRDGAS